MGKSTLELMDEVVDAMDRGSLVPLLGAGLSYTASTDLGEQPHARLKEKLKRYLGSISNPMLPSKEHIANESSLARLSEWVWMVAGPVKLCQELEIARFTELQPTDAHRAIAWLMLEEAITEVITTNYDTCLEDAFAGAHQGGGGLPVLEVVTDEAGYAGQLQSDNDPAGCRPVPADADGTGRRIRLYKINGCAHRWTNHQTKKEAERIILTERQLQTFREEQWARDLLSDRARSSKIMLSGFGAEEPQVRHTVLAVIKEFRGKRTGAKQVWSLHNTPVVHVYEDAPSFSQLQLLWAWRAARQRKPKLNNGVLSNTFSAKHRDYFMVPDHTGCADTGLLADHLWLALFNLWWYRRLQTIWRRSTLAELVAARIGTSPDYVRVCAMKEIERLFGNSGERCRATEHLLPDGQGRLSAMTWAARAFGAELGSYYRLQDHEPFFALLFVLARWLKDSSWLTLTTIGRPAAQLEPKHASCLAIELPATDVDLPRHASRASTCWVAVLQRHSNPSMRACFSATRAIDGMELVASALRAAPGDLAAGLDRVAGPNFVAGVHPRPTDFRRRLRPVAMES